MADGGLRCEEQVSGAGGRVWTEYPFELERGHYPSALGVQDIGHMYMLTRWIRPDFRLGAR